MNRFQRVSAGVQGSIENTLDDLRHTWEKFAYGEKVTGDVNMFPPNPYPEPELNSFYAYQPPEPAAHELGQDILR
jgi:hypothetical protein